ncbi:MAG: class I SAM-dependent methyltransferase [Candidatus Aminicenantes bacterium]|nr:class I SAM-dependent methyltransferase [Candidatus Aminicenantes bacterium]
MENSLWQIQLVKRSLKKKEKLEILAGEPKLSPSAIVLDLGCAQGILSFFLKKKGGFWIHADQDLENLETSRPLLQSNLLQLGPGLLPFKDNSIEQVFSLDYLEHLDDDLLCLKEIHRILKKGGKLIIATPRTGKGYLLHKLRPFLGMKLEFYGHKREGYTPQDLKAKMEEAGLLPVKTKTFSRFFTEFLELLLNFAYITFMSPKNVSKLRDGRIRPSSSTEFQSKKKAFKFYTLIYPLVRLVSYLDVLLFWQRGYGLMIWAKKKDKNPRKDLKTLSGLVSDETIIKEKQEHGA